MKTPTESQRADASRGTGDRPKGQVDTAWIEDRVRLAEGRPRR